ncbi:MAG: Histidine--tRNA ligase [Bacteroidia bacterium]|jgi:histidyl-tRNA synthetase|nr:MAG: Histidine--tRNA ligase [Bacteroidia bacterium]
MQKPSNPQGTRDFGPEVMRKRNIILDTIQGVFKKYAFEPLETPAIENLSMLTGKYGDEGDKLLYKIRSNREIVHEIDDEKAQKITELFPDRWIPGKSKLGLRYDLTVPFARFVVQHRNEISFPFRRYQIQPVWRADRPQKGRFREFTQCDADCIGSSSLIHEADLIHIYDEVFNKLGLSKAVVKLNHRKFLEAMVDELSLDFPVSRFTSTLDKLDKIGKDGVINELINAGVSEIKCKQLFELITISDLNETILDKLTSSFNQNALAMAAIGDLRELVRFLGNSPRSIKLELDLSLARGLDYYTGCIFEAVIPDSGIGSVSGGGRYDNLTDIFGLKDVSGVGISFGVDRIYEILDSQNLWPNANSNNQSVLICHFDQETQEFGVRVAQKLRQSEISVLVYPDKKRINKQLDFANNKGFSHAIVIGQDEMESGILTLKDLFSGDQMKLSIEDCISQLKL